MIAGPVDENGDENGEREEGDSGTPLSAGENTVNYFENDGVKRAVLLLNTALALRGACEDVTPYYEDDYWDYHPANYVRAEQRLTELLDYFDALAANLPDQVSESSRSLSQERALIQQLLTNVRNRGW